MLTAFATVDVLTGLATVLTAFATVDVLTGLATVLTAFATVDVLTGFATVLATGAATVAGAEDEDDEDECHRLVADGVDR